MFFRARSDSARSAGCLDFDDTAVANARYARYACDRPDLDGTPRSAEAIQRVALANVSGEHARLRLTAECWDSRGPRMGFGRRLAQAWTGRRGDGGEVTSRVGVAAAGLQRVRPFAVNP